MQVRSVRQQMGKISGGDKRKKPAPIGIPSSKEALFLEELKEIVQKEGELRKKELEQLIKDIDAQANIFLSHSTKEEAIKYRQLVKVFLDKALKQAYEVRGSRSSDKAKRKNLYTVIVEIDHKVVELTDQVIRRQKPILNLMKSMEEIRGLLMDILL